MKRLLIGTSLLLVGINTMAQSEYFIGANVSNSNASIETSYEYTSSTTHAVGNGSKSDSDTNIHLKIGINKANNRYYLQYGTLYDGYINNYSISYKTININYDTLLEKTSNGLIPFIGLHIGQGTLELNNVETDGTEWGFQTGIINNINKNIQFETGLRYSIASANFSVTLIDGDTTQVYDVSADDAIELYVGFNYKF